MEHRTDVRPELARRFEFIEWRIFWQGRINRSELEERFEVSAAQASADLRAYEEAAPGNIRYDNADKAFLPTPGFKPKYIKNFGASGDRYLAQLNAIQNQVVAPGDTWFGSPPPAAVMPLLHSVEPRVLQRMLEAIRKFGAVAVEYQSMTNTRTRKIAPHALAFDGFRWHVRALCLENNEFRDFVLTRMLSVGEVEDIENNSMKDMEWLRTVDLRIVPHPDLSPEQQAAIAHDFGMEAGVLVLKLRIALAFYAIKRLNLDLDLEEIPPERKQIVLANRDEVVQREREAKKLTTQLLQPG